MKGKINLKTIIVFVILILVVVLSVLGVKTVRTYMSGATAGVEPKNVAATLSDDGKSVTITWVSDKESMGVVLYGTNMASMLVTAAESTQTTNHSVVLNNLRANATWYYKIQIEGVDFENNGMPYTFNTKGVAEDTGAIAVPSPEVNNVPDAAASPSGMMLSPTIALSPISTSSSKTCNKTTDYNKDGVINSMDVLTCMKNGSSTAPVASPAATTGSTCAHDVDYNKDGVINALDYIKCLQDNKK